jgi:GDP-L-fucose synthase
MHDFWRGKRVLVTGGAGFIGSHVVRALLERGCEVTTTLYRGEENTDKISEIQDRISVRAVDLTRIEESMEVCHGQNVVFSLAHLDGTVEFKKSRPAYILRQNLLITMNLLEAAGRSGAERFLLASSAEVYPLSAPAPTSEDQAFRDMGDRPSDGYAWSKRMSELAVRTFAKEYGLQVAIARPNNVYGPGDYFDYARGRVIPRFIRTVADGADRIVLWGTGEASRTFLFVEDLVRGILLLAEKYPEADPVNLAGDEEISIRDLAALIIGIFGRDVEIVCERDKPSGPLRRRPDTTKAREVLGFSPAVPLETGLRLTIQSYLSQASKDLGTAGMSMSK